MAHFFSAIAYGKGIVLCEQHHGKLNGQSFANFVREHFPLLFTTCSNPKGKLFVQDGDPSDNSRRAKDAIHAIGARKFSIPPRSPDINPIENILHQVKRKLNADSLGKHIEHEKFENFSKRVKQTMQGFPKDVTDKTIESMNKRIDLIIKCKGQRTKY